MKFKNFRILLESGCSNTIVMGRLLQKIHPEKDSVMQCHMKSSNINTNHKVKLEFTLPALSTTYVMTWKCHVDDFAKGRYHTILGRDLLS